MPDEDGGFLSRRLRWDSGDRESSSADEPVESEAAPGRLRDAERWDDEIGWSGRPSETGPLSSGATDIPSYERLDLARMDLAALNRRRQLWRDTALLLSGVVALLLV